MDWFLERLWLIFMWPILCRLIVLNAKSTFLTLMTIRLSNGHLDSRRTEFDLYDNWIIIIMKTNKEKGECFGEKQLLVLQLTFKYSHQRLYKICLV